MGDLAKFVAAIREAIHKLPGKSDDDLQGADSLELAVDVALGELRARIEAQAAKALKCLDRFSESASDIGGAAIFTLFEVSEKMLSGEIDRASADLAVGNVLETLELLGKAKKEKDRVENFQKGLRTVQMLKRVLIPLVELSVSIAAPGVSRWLQAFDINALIDAALGIEGTP